MELVATKMFFTSTHLNYIHKPDILYSDSKYLRGCVFNPCTLN